MGSHATTKWQFDPDWRLTLLTLLLLPLMTWLGFWQLSRATEKQALLEHEAIMLAQQPAVVDTLDLASPEKHQFRRVRIDGSILPGKIFLLENRVYQGKPGVEVLMLVETASDRPAWVVNFGWLAAPTQENPDFPPMEGRLSWQGDLYKPEVNRFIRDSTTNTDGWPKRILSVDFDRIQEISGRAVQPMMIRLDPDPASGFSREWPVVNMKPEKHTAYAIQWFAMAITLLVAYVLASYKRKSP